MFGSIFGTNFFGDLLRSAIISFGAYILNEYGIDLGLECIAGAGLIAGGVIATKKAHKK